jgi:hemerythrin superfamily protein
MLHPNLWDSDLQYKFAKKGVANMNAIDFLKKEHEKVRRLLANIKDSSHGEDVRKRLFDELCQDLLRHEKMEQTVWYPRIKQHDEIRLDETIKHLVTEEKGAEKLIKDINATESEEEWEKKFLHFKKEVEHHADEEETKLFPKVAKLLSDDELEELGKEMREFKNAAAA